MMSRRPFSLGITLVFLAFFLLSGCAAHRSVEPVPPVPLPPQKETVEEKALPEKQTLTAGDAKKQTLSAGQQDRTDGPYLTVETPTDLSGAPRRDEPDELAELLEMKASFGPDDTAVRQMRPSAIREAAQLVTLQTAMAWRYGQLMDATEQYAAIMDTAFDFGPLLMTQGDALIMPPVLTRAGASMRIEQPETATAARASYELLDPAHYISVVPNWRSYLMADAFPEPEKPNPALIPKNRKERRIWREAVREAWTFGIEEADQLYVDNVSRMVRDYRGIMLYHLLTAQHLLSQVRMASADLGIRSKANMLHLGQRVYRITAPALFTPPKAVPDKQAPRKKRTRK